MQLTFLGTGGAAGAGVRLRLPDLPTGAARAGISAASVQRHA